MRDGWSDELLRDAPSPNEAFRESLRERLLDAWDDDDAPTAVAAGRRRRRWAVATAAAVLVAGIVGLILVRTTNSSDGPTAGGQATTTAGVVGVVAQDVVGAWVVTESGGRPRPSPLPTFYFKIGTSSSGVGVVTGFNGCGVIAGTWNVDDGQLHVGIDTGGGGQPCPYLNGTTPLVLPSDASMESVGGELVMRFGAGGNTIAHRVDSLFPLASLAGSSWLFPADGPDLTLAFAQDDLSVSVDSKTCTTSAYRFNGTTLQVSSPSSGTTAGPCRGAVPTPIDGTPTTIVRYGDDAGASLLLITPSAGTWRVYPASAATTVEASAASSTTFPLSTTSTATAPPNGEATAPGSTWLDSNGTALVGRWTDGRNTFEFSPDGRLRFTFKATCDGSYDIHDGLITVDFGDCDADAVNLSSPIFRSAKVYATRNGETIILDGDAGITRLERAP